MSDAWNIFLIWCTLGTIFAIWIVSARYSRQLIHFGLPFIGLMFVTYVIRPYLAMTAGTGFRFLDIYMPGMSDAVVENVDALALAYVLTVVSFAAGYRFLKRNPIDLKHLYIPNISDQRKELYVRCALILMTVGYVSFLFVQRASLFGETTIEYVRYAGGVVFANSTGYIEYANYLVVAGAVLYYAASKRLFITMLLAGPWLINQIYSGWQRYMFINLAVGLFIVALLLRTQLGARGKRQVTVLLVLATGAVVLLLAMRGTRNFAQEGLSLSELTTTAVQRPIDEVLADFAGFEGTWHTIRNIDEINPYYGASIFYRFLVLPIPRMLWPDKPLKVEFSWNTLVEGEQASSRWRAGLVNVNDFIWFNTAVKGSIGYAIEEWGWIGIPINFFLTGLFFGYIERRFVRSSLSPTWLSIYAITYAIITMQGRNDLFEFLIVYILIFYLPYWLIERQIRIETPKESMAGTAPNILVQGRFPPTERSI